jgi:peptide/nickel transport system permease protein
MSANSNTALHRLWSDRRARVAIGLLVVMALLAAFGPLFLVAPDAPIGIPHSPPSSAHWLGTTGQGQDVLAQTLVGARSSLLLGFFVGIVATLFGAFIGVIAGFAGRGVDAILSLVINVFLVLPGLPLAIVLAAYLPSSPLTVAFVLILTGWSWNARVMRSQTLALRERDFVLAAKVSGAGSGHIVMRELLPNMTSLLVAQMIGSTTYAIGAEVGLEFLGLGDVSRISWGTNLYWATNDSALLTGAWWTFVPTGVCVALVGLSLALLATSFDELSNPRLGYERPFNAFLGRAGVKRGFSTPVVSGTAR